MKYIRWALIILLAAAFSIVAVSNRTPVVLSLKPLPYTAEMPLFIILFGTFFIGLIVGSFFSWLRGRPTRRALKDAQKRLTGVEAQLATKPSQPLPNA